MECLQNLFNSTTFKKSSIPLKSNLHLLLTFSDKEHCFFQPILCVEVIIIHLLCRFARLGELNKLKANFFSFSYDIKIRCHKMAVVHLEPPILEGGIKPPNVFKSTLDYPNEMWESAFYVSQSFESLRWGDSNGRSFIYNKKYPVISLQSFIFVVIFSWIFSTNLQNKYIFVKCSNP